MNAVLGRFAIAQQKETVPKGYAIPLIIRGRGSAGPRDAIG
jgi:hypothetical protein